MRESRPFSKTDVATDKLSVYWNTVFIDNFTDAIYVGYCGKKDGSETLTTTTHTYYTKSTDGGATWTAGDTAYQQTTGTTNNRQLWSPLCGPRLYMCWRDGASSLVLTGNAVNSLSFALVPPVVPVLIHSQAINRAASY